MQGVEVLIAEEAESDVELLAPALSEAGFVVRVVGDGISALEAVVEDEPLAVVIDLDLPDLDGRDVCRRIRKVSSAYIVALSAHHTIEETVKVLEGGADDYVSKPFSRREIIARLRSYVRRARLLDTGHRSVAGIDIDLDAQRVTRGADEIDLTRIEFELLDVLTRHPDRVISRDELLERVWGQEWVGANHLVDVHVSNLRRKLGEPSPIETVRGVGFRFAPF